MGRLLIAKSGKSIESTVLDDFIFHSDYPMLKVHTFFTFSFALALEQTTVMHNLGYYPYAIVFAKTVGSNFGSPVISSEYYQLPYYIEGASIIWRGEVDVKTDRLVIKISNSDAPGGAQQIAGFGYIFKDRLDSI